MKEAQEIALRILTDAEKQRRKSIETEARFERRLAFLEYGEAALLMMVDKGNGEDDGALSNEDFLAKYGVEKKDVNYALILLDLAKGDINKRNEIYDFFIGIL